MNGTILSFHIDENGILKHGTRLCVLAIGELKRPIMEEAHSTPYTVHPGSTKINLDLKINFWWSGMKADIAKYVSQCLVCQQVKAEHQRPIGLLQPLSILEWKWEHIIMDFVVGLPKTL